MHNNDYLIFWLAYVLPGLIFLLGFLIFGRINGDPISNWKRDDKEKLLFIIIWPIGVFLAALAGVVYLIGKLLDLTTKEIKWKKEK